MLGLPFFSAYYIHVNRDTGRIGFSLGCGCDVWIVNSRSRTMDTQRLLCQAPSTVPPATARELLLMSHMLRNYLGHIDMGLIVSTANDRHSDLPSSSLSDFSIRLIVSFAIDKKSCLYGLPACDFVIANQPKQSNTENM
jgi:hypothetical protein